jgi:hypothetical protein
VHQAVQKTDYELEKLPAANLGLLNDKIHNLLEGPKPGDSGL